MDKITIKQYSELSDKIAYDSVLSKLRPLNKFNGNSLDLNKITYKQVRSLFKMAKEGKTINDMFDLFSLAFSVNESQFWNASIEEYFSAQNYIVNRLGLIQCCGNKLVAID
jgi:hypothetical protein